MTKPIPEATIVRIVQSFYDAVDSLDADRISGLYLPGPSTTLQFNADSPIVTVEAIKAFSARFTQAIAGIYCPSYFFHSQRFGSDASSAAGDLHFTIDKQTEKFVSVHNMFDIDKVYNAIRSQQN